MKMNINTFGVISAEHLDEYYTGNIEINGKLIDIDLNFESESVDESLLISVDTVLKNIRDFADKAWNAISDDWDLNEGSETARFYLQHHLEEFSEEEILTIFGTTEIDKRAFMSALSLTRVGLYPEDADMFIVFDIQFPDEHTNYLMSLSLTQDGLVNDLSLQS